MKTFVKNIPPDYELIGSFAFRCGRFVFAKAKTTSSSGGSQTSSGSSGPDTEAETNEVSTSDKAQYAQASRENKTPETLSPAEKTPAVGESVDLIRSVVSENIGEAIGTANEAIKAAQTRENNELSENMEKFRDELRNLRGVAEDSQKKLREKINRLLDERKIAAEKAKELLNLGASLPDFESRLNKIADRLKSKLSPDELRELIEEKKKEAAGFEKVRAEFERITGRMSELLEKARHHIYQEAHKETALREHGRQLGFPLKTGTTLRFRYLRPVLKPSKDENGKVIKDEKGETVYVHEKDAKGNLKYEPIFRKATIREVKFRTFDVKSEGKKTTFASLTPTVVLDIVDEWPDKNGIVNKNSPELNADRLKEVVDMQDVTRVWNEKPTPAEDCAEAGKVLGKEIKQGAIFAYRDVSMTDEGIKGSDREVMISRITREKDEFFDTPSSQRKDREQTIIHLDHEVVVRHHPVQEKRSRLTLGEFIKWAVRMDAAPPEKMGLDDLRTKLKLENEERNDRDKRNPKAYPPIELKKDEILCYDTAPPVLFRIKDLKEDKIILDNGSEYTPSGFLNWVKENEVEKFSPRAEAEKKTALMEENTEEQKEEKEEAKKKAEEDAEEIEKNRKKPPSGYAVETSEKHSPPSAGFLRKLYNQTYFLSLGSFYEMGKLIIEYIKRHMERAEKERIGAVGSKALSFFEPFGREFEVIKQNAETEAVNYYKGAFDQFGYEGFISRLAVTKSRDELKALLMAMSDKGFINWHDKALWAAITRVASQDVNTFVFVDKEHNEDNIRTILDKFWGQDSFRDFKNKNDHAYHNRVNENKSWAIRLENDPEQRGGIKGRLQYMLHQHLNGEWMDPAIYEALLYTAIENGKLTFADKIYFLVMGFGMEGKKGSPNEGKPLLDWYSLSQLEGNLLNKFPVLDYFTGDNLQKVNEKGEPLWDTEKKAPKKGQIGINELKQIIRTVIEPDAGQSIASLGKPADFEPGANLQKFIETEMILNPAVVSRLKDKSAKDFENWDHDDFHMFGSQVKERQIENLAQKNGAKQNASMAAVKNTFAGLNHFAGKYLNQFIETAKSGDEEKAQQNIHRMSETIKALIRLDAVVGNRFHHDKHDHIKFSSGDYRSYAGVDARRSRTVRETIREVYRFVEGVLEEMNKYVPARTVQDLSKTWYTMLHDFGSSHPELQREQITAHNSFGRKFESALAIMQEKVGNKGVAEIFDRIQNGTVPGNRLIKGIQEPAKNKLEMQESEESMKETFKFEKIKAIDLGELAGEYKRLKNQVETETGQGAIDKKAKVRQKLEATIALIDQEKYDQVSLEEENLLKKAIDEARNALGMTPLYNEKQGA